MTARVEVRSAFGLFVTAVAVLALATVLSTGAVVAAPALQSGSACASVGWRAIEGPEGSFSALAASASLDRVYVGTRDTEDDSNRPTLYDAPLNSTAWQPVAGFDGIRVSDIVLTPGAATETWVSTFGYGESFDGNVLGRSGLDLFSGRGSLKTWYMQMAANGQGVFVAVSKPGEKGVYRWDEPTGEWVYKGGSDIPTDYFRQFEAGLNGKLWLGTDRQGLWVSEDAGVTWTPSRGAGETVWSLAVSRSELNTVMVGLGPPSDGSTSYPRGLRMTQDGGETWTNYTSPGLGDADYVTAVAFGTHVPGEAYAAAWTDGLYKSKNFGQTWQLETSPQDQEGMFDALLSVNVESQVDCHLLFAAGAHGVWVRSTVSAPEAIFVPVAAQRVDLTSP